MQMMENLLCVVMITECDKDSVCCILYFSNFRQHKTA